MFTHIGEGLIDLDRPQVRAQIALPFLSQTIEILIEDFP